MKLRAVGTANPQQPDVNAVGQVDQARTIRGAQRLADARHSANKTLTFTGAEL